MGLQAEVADEEHAAGRQQAVAVLHQPRRQVGVEVVEQAGGVDDVEGFIGTIGAAGEAQGVVTHKPYLAIQPAADALACAVQRGRVTSVPLTALPPADALAFLRYQGQERNAAALLQAPESDLRRIVAVTGGHPLAIKLVVGQAQALPLTQVLDDLAAAQPEVHDFYHFVFRYAWQRLSDPARQLLLHMPLLNPAGATWEDLAAVSGVSLNGYYRSALEELVAASLLDSGCAQGRLLYSIHRLTEYFILSDLIGVEPPGPLA